MPEYSRIWIDGIAHGAADGFLNPGAGRLEWFKDHPHGPEMVVVPAGCFLMGAPATELGRKDNEGPQVKITFAEPFAVGRFAVTFDEWDACIADGGCSGYRPSDKGHGRGRRPVINVSLEDGVAYVAWLSNQTGKTYRLLSEAEWEYAARAGTTTPYWWGHSIATSQANYFANPADYREGTVEVDSFEPNPWGLYQVHGNVHEWTQGWYHESYKGWQADGSIWTRGDLTRAVVRGGGRLSDAAGLRSASRNWVMPPSLRSGDYGLRVCRTLTTAEMSRYAPTTAIQLSISKPSRT